MTTTTVPRGHVALSQRACAALRDAVTGRVYSFADGLSSDADDPAALRGAADELTRAAELLEAADAGHGDRDAILMAADDVVRYREEYAHSHLHYRESAIGFAVLRDNPLWTGCSGDGIRAAHADFAEAEKARNMSAGASELLGALL